MNFKKIEIFGFKSFADKVEVVFNDGITGIVGPNGCGKSNVADAIRWVLGEQSAKLLRGKNMQDVIFNGTARRKQLSYCEVSLVFDNTNRIFPNVAYDEIVITRKLFRSGDSEYYVNRTPCRLRDIQDMIRDTGLGREGYSIVGQGRVAEIVDARPKARRAIFEDAAGVLKFKQRKIESERKLERTEDNISRLEDIINEVGRRLAPLEKQSNDAKKYLELRDLLRDLEVNDYLYQYENNDQRKQNALTVLEGIDQELAQKERDRELLEKQYQEKSVEQNNVDAYIARLRDRQTELAVEAEAVKGQGSTLAERIANLKDQRAAYAKRIVDLEEEMDEKSDRLTDYVSRMSMEKEELGDLSAEHKAMSDEHMALVDEILRRERQMDETNLEKMKALESIGDIKADLGKLMTEREITLTRLAEIEEEIKAIQQQIEADERAKKGLEDGVERCRRDKDSLAVSKNEVTAEVSALRGRIEHGREELRTLTGSIQALESKCKVLEEFKKDYDALGLGVKRLMQAAQQSERIKNCIQGVVAELITVPKELETAIERALGGSMSNVVTANENDARTLIEFLKQNRLGTMTFLPLTSYKARELEEYLRPITKEKGCVGIASKLIKYDKKYDSIFSGLLGRTIVVDQYENAVAISRKYRSAVRIVTLDGSLFATSGAISGGSAKSSASNVLGQGREIETLKQELGNQKTRFNQLTRSIKQDQEELAELEEQQREYEEEVKNAEVAYATENGKLDKVCSKLAVLLQDLQKLSGSKRNIVEKLKVIDEAISNIDRKDADMSSMRSDAESEAARHKEENERKKNRRDELSAGITDLLVRMKECEAQIANQEANIERTKQECSDITAQIAECKASLKEVDERIYQTENNLNTAKVSEEDRKRYQEIVDKIASLDEYKKTLNQEVAELVARKDAAASDLAEITGRRMKQAGMLDKINDEIAIKEQHVAEEYGLTYESAKQYRREEFDFAAAQSEIVRVRRAKNALGAVNVDAIEEFRVEGARYREMTEERDDLRQAAEDLKKIIEDVSREMLAQFEREFEKINTNFQQVFTEIFGGGSGKLVIEPPEEGESWLDAGIEIMAEPPGKKLQSITLLSGGEKALIAIAILFAILRIKAMPFCVLDEIEAALDDANAGLFARYLGKFSHETQFIVITHRKPTMELADRLYGVTMQEKGVSKVVTVSLADAVKQSKQAE